MAQQPNPSEIVESRIKYAKAFTNTMMEIWEDRILRYKAYDSMTLFKSIQTIKSLVEDDGGYLDFLQKFKEYGIYVDRGTGKEVYRNNPGDIGRHKVRQPKEWFSKRFYSSCKRLTEFMAKSFGQQGVAMICQISKKQLNEAHTIASNAAMR